MSAHPDGARARYQRQGGTIPSSPTIGPKQLTPFTDELVMPHVLQVDAYNQALSPCMRVSFSLIEAQLHAALPSTIMPGFNRQFPGPVIEVTQDHPFNIEWIDRLPKENTNPSAAVVAHEKTEPAQQVFPEAPSIMVTYPNNLPAAATAYFTPLRHPNHDRNCTQVVGIWIIRDALDKAILAALNKYELPLLMQDCYLEADDTGRLTGKLLSENDGSHRHTLVNGKIWPFAEVQARPYRFRLLNASASTHYQLLLHDAGNTPRNSAIGQLGTIHGRLNRAIYFSAHQTLPLAAGEAADILIDFSSFRGQQIRLVNVSGPNTLPENNLIQPVMEFRVNSRDSGKSFATLNLPI